jgi:hypothetical protein
MSETQVRGSTTYLVGTQCGACVAVQRVEASVVIEIDDGTEMINAHMSPLKARILARYLFNLADLAETRE